MFYLSRAAVELLAPFPLSILLLILALFSLAIRKVRLGALCLILALFLQIFCGYGFLARQRVADLEALYPAVTEAGLQELQGRRFTYVVVLGSGHVSDNRLPAISQIGGASLYRLVEGISKMKWSNRPDGCCLPPAIWSCQEEFFTNGSPNNGCISKKV